MLFLAEAKIGDWYEVLILQLRRLYVCKVVFSHVFHALGPFTIDRVRRRTIVIIHDTSVR
jgi:hypothetical protein